MCNNWSVRMEDTVERLNCFFYDSEQKPHGGPAPNQQPEPPRNGHHEDWDTGLVQWLPSERRRRQAEEVPAEYWAENPLYKEDESEGPKMIQTFDVSRDDYMHPNWLDVEIMKSIDNELCHDDCVENNDCSGSTCNSDLRGSGDKKIQRLIKQGPWKGARSILTGFRKFGERYLSQCHGHRKGTHMRKRTQFIVRVSKKFLTHCDHEQCNREFVDNKNFKWGKKNLRTDYAGK